MGAFRARLLVGATALLLALLPVAGRAQQREPTSVPREIVLVSEEWENYTQANGTGLGWDVLRHVFEPRGVTVRASTVPYLRAVGLVSRGDADAWVGAYLDEAPDTLYPKWPYDVDEVYALGLADTLPPTLASLGYFRVAWMRGYQFERYLPHITEFNEVRRRDSILSMLELRRADLYIDAKTEIDNLLRRTPRPDHFRATFLTTLPLYLSFTNSARGRALRALYDQRMEELVRSGELKAIFERWKHPYPFEEPTAGFPGK